MFTGIGLAATTLVILPAVLKSISETAKQHYGIFDVQVYGPALIIGLVAFISQAVAASSYNATKWASEYLDWQQQRVCRSCGCLTPAPDLGDSQ